MASVSVVSQRAGGGAKETTVDITFDSSYPTGGEVFTNDDVKMQSILYGEAKIKSVTGSVNITSVYIAPSATGFNAIAYNETPAQVTNTNSLNNVVIRAHLYGR